MVRFVVRVKVRHIDPSDDVMLAPFIFRSLQAVTLQPVSNYFLHRCAQASSWVRRLRSELAAREETIRKPPVAFNWAGASKTCFG